MTARRFATHRLVESRTRAAASRGTNLVGSDTGVVSDPFWVATALPF
jgi:hypothetical protein